MKLAMDGRLRKLHRRDWPGFLNRVVPAPTWQSFQRSAGGREDPRTRWTPKYIVLCWAIIGWSVQHSLQERFREGTEVLTGLFVRRRRPGSSYQGLVKATAVLGWAPHHFWCCLRPQLPRRLSNTWNWHGWVVIAVDGSRIDAPRTRRNERKVGLAGRDKTHPQWYVTWAVHLPTGIIWDWRQGPARSSERSHLKSMLKTLPASCLVVADAGFGGFDLLWKLSKAGVSFLVRCASNTTLLVEGTRQKIEAAGGHPRVFLWPTGRRSKKPLLLRLIVLKRGGKRVYLLTNVMESTRLSRRMAAELYEARWGIEVGYRSLKQTLDRRKVLARTPEPGGMELAGNILALALLMLQGALVLGARAARLSVAAALRVLRRAIEAIRFGDRYAAFVSHLRAAIKDGYSRRRSKRARDWPHKKKQTPPLPAKLRRPTRAEKLKIMWFLVEHGSLLS
jgi:hypothetical protein